MKLKKAKPQRICTCPRCETADIVAYSVRDEYWETTCPNCGHVNITIRQNIITHRDFFGNKETKIPGITEIKCMYSDGRTFCYKVKEIKRAKNTLLI